MARPRNEKGRAEVRRASFRLFMEQGYTKTTYRSIAEACGRERSTVQSLFPEKSLLATDLLNRLVYGCQKFSEENGLASDNPISSLKVIGRLYFGFLLSSVMRRFTVDVAADRSITSSSLLFNEDWVREFLSIEGADLDRCMNSFVLAMGGGYEIVYQDLKALVSVSVPDMVDMIIKSFVANSGVASLERAQKAAEKTPEIDDKLLDESVGYLRDWVLQ